jgi:16S rRNA processing protein RimM
MEKKSKKSPKMLIAQIGRAVGLKGELKLNLHTDFPEQFKKGVSFETPRGKLEIENYNQKRGLIKFKGFDTPEDAKALTNIKLYSTEEETKKRCSLKDGEYFWFDIIGCEVIEGVEVVGKVKDIQRVLDIDYLLISTADEFIKQDLPKTFLIPYIDRYIESVDIENKKIFVKDAIDILKAS